MAATKKSGQGSKSTKKKTSSARTKKAQSTKQKNTTAVAGDSFLKDEVVLLIVLAIAILLMLGNFKIGGAFGDVVNSFMFGVFGLMSYVMPLFLFFGTAFIISNKVNQIASIKLFAWILLFLVLCTFFELTFVQDLKELKILECFTYSKVEKTGGGILGGIFAKMFSTVFGMVGAYVVDAILAIISIVLITEKSFFQGVEKSSRKVYETAKTGADKHREHRERAKERQRMQEEENRRRMDKKVSGVSMDLNLATTKKKRSKEEMHEITIQGAPIAEQKLDGSYVDVFAEMEIPVPEPLVEAPEIPVEPIMQPILQPEIAAEPQTSVEPVISPKSEMQKKSEKPAAKMTETQAKPQKQPAMETPQNLENMELPKDDVTTSPYKSTIDVGEEESAVIEEKPVEYQFPPFDLLKRGSNKALGDSQEHLKETAMKLQQTLQNFGVNVKITNVSCGPAVTRYEIQPEQGVKVSKIVNLTDDIKLNLAAADIRIEAPIPGKLP